jgi:hypothetical protein
MGGEEGHEAGATAEAVAWAFGVLLLLANCSPAVEKPNTVAGANYDFDDRNSPYNA